MATTQRVVFPNGSVSTTVLGADRLPVAPAEQYLAFLRLGSSPNTVRAYARALALWFSGLEANGHSWQEFPGSVFGDFLQAVKAGDAPGTSRIGPAPSARAPATVHLRSAAVLAFYQWQAAANGVLGPYQTLFTSRGRRRTSRYIGALTGIADRGEDRATPIYRVRSGPRGRTPVLLPAQVRVILDGCSTQSADGSWSGSAAGLRNRLLFAVLAETGMRFGEALLLRHKDFNIGSGSSPSIDVIPRQDHPHGVRGKSRDSRRVVVGVDLEALYSHYVWQLVHLGIDADVPDVDGHFMFVNLARGQRFSPMRPETLYAKIRSLNRRFPDDLPTGWTPHWFRHTHASALLLAGKPTTMVMRRLGHQDIQTTVGTYGWVTEDQELLALADWKNYVAGWRGIFDGAT